ncbi:AAA family ATPase [Crocosphaera sp. UHCC 0190]|uniref:AAA family ATPase n=1 Tax=Crocosphaera sp. UHCC 0190 TaxID=3110246 RepID=UPI002B1F26E7|nr:AAA family ATPase [Crocosphaera sp. UHCC 0190]MEA5509166.1 AAA family ATPase [Crocosphaera sp. UHCC 0190]
MNKKQLESLHIHSFRGIRDLELNDLGRINLFVGINNCGKTSVLEAISLYCNPLNLREWYTISRQRENESKFSYLSIPDSITLLFPYDYLNNNKLDEGIILITSNGLYPIKKIKAFYKRIESLRSDGQLSLFDIEQDQERNLWENSHNSNVIQTGILLQVKISFLKNNLEEEITEKFELWKNDRIINLNRSQGLQIDYTAISPSSHRTESYAPILLTQAKIKGFTLELISLLKSLDPNIQDLEILTHQSTRGVITVYVQHNKMGLVPLSTFGDGVRRLVYIALELVQLKDGILLIDEIETAIHTEALKDSFSWIVTWCKQLNIQLFATTHSLEAVDAILAATDSDTDLVLYRLEQKETKTDAIRIGRDRLQRLRENLGQEVRW